MSRELVDLEVAIRRLGKSRRSMTRLLKNESISVVRQGRGRKIKIVVDAKFRALEAKRPSGAAAVSSALLPRDETACDASASDIFSDEPAQKFPDAPLPLPAPLPPRFRFDPSGILWWDKASAFEQQMFEQACIAAYPCRTAAQVKLWGQCMARMNPKLFGDAKDGGTYTPGEYADALFQKMSISPSEILVALREFANEDGELTKEVFDQATREYYQALEALDKLKVKLNGNKKLSKDEFLEVAGEYIGQDKKTKK